MRMVQVEGRYIYSKIVNARCDEQDRIKVH